MSRMDMENILKLENPEGTDRKRKSGELLGGTVPANPPNRSKKLAKLRQEILRIETKIKASNKK